MFSPSSLATVLIGLWCCFAGLMLLLRTEQAKRLLDAFPRHRLAGFVITLVCIVWSCMLVMDLPDLGRFNVIKTAMYGVGPVAFVLIICYLDELLAARSLGGLMLLLGVPILRAIIWHESPWRILISVLVYVMVFKGMALVLGPFRFRRWVNWLWREPIRVRVASMASLAIGVLLLGLGVTVLR